VRRAGLCVSVGLLAPSGGRFAPRSRKRLFEKVTRLHSDAGHESEGILQLSGGSCAIVSLLAPVGGSLRSVVGAVWQPPNFKKETIRTQASQSCPRGATLPPTAASRQPMFLCNGGGFWSGGAVAPCGALCLLRAALCARRAFFCSLRPHRSRQPPPNKVRLYAAHAATVCPRSFVTVTHKPICRTLCGVGLPDPVLLCAGNWYLLAIIRGTDTNVRTSPQTIFVWRDIFKGRKNNFPPLFLSEIFFHSAVQPLKRKAREDLPVPTLPALAPRRESAPSRSNGDAQSCHCALL
jgi:hypothetical protein